MVFGGISIADYGPSARAGVPCPIRPDFSILLCVSQERRSTLQRVSPRTFHLVSNARQAGADASIPMVEQDSDTPIGPAWRFSLLLPNLSMPYPLNTSHTTKPSQP